ncbi:MAG: DEAD/DEAH box helicase family protein [Acidobacteria bacterium]|nr:DEAD/DEAH box helicase family protein [Acidobacteriota bacterium]
MATKTITWRDAIWPHQRKAVDVVRKFQASGESGAALVRMPTGTGKTGIMAALAQGFSDTQNILVVAPWAHLKGQIASELSERFWEKLGSAPKELKPASPAVPSEFAKQLKNTTPKVLVCTAQGLALLQSTMSPVYEALKKQVDLVLVDEGHREPAPAWAEAVRNLEHPTVLFTATPYRNDWRLFRLNPGFTSAFYFPEAVRERFIRDVKFEEQQFDAGPEAFVRALIAFYQGPYKKRAPKSAERVIVRCATQASVQEVAAAIKAKGYSVMAVHDNFGVDEEETYLNKVPDPKKNTALFWVHQNKLIEGLDDPRFGLVAIYQTFGNDRGLVQQIGRVLRNPNRSPNQTAWVFSHVSAGVSKTWSAYVRYEEWLSQGGVELGPDQIFSSLLGKHAEYHYLEGRFRERFDPEAKDVHEHLAYPQTALIYESEPSYDVGQCAASVRETLDHEDLLLLNEVAPDSDTRIFVYIRCSPSPLLLDQTFLELQLGFSALRKAGRYVFFQDSQGITPEYLTTHGTKVDPGKLERTLSAGDVRVSTVTLMNSDLSLYSVRRRMLSATSIAALAPGLGDHASFCSTATAVLRDGDAVKRRYLGFTRSRLSEPTGGRVNYGKFIQWVDGISAVLEKDNAQEVDALARYALYQKAPDKAQASHILLDIDDVLDQLTVPRADNLGGAPVFLDDRCWDVVKDQFRIPAFGKEHEVSIGYKDHRFELTSEFLSQVVLRESGGPQGHRTLLAHLNATQAFRVITQDGGIYAHGRFYRSRFPLHGRSKGDRIDLLKILHPVKALEAIKKEKEPVSPGGAGWEKASVFGLIDDPQGELFASQAFKPDILLCDDLGNEWADFIALRSTPPAVIFIHAKAAKEDSDLSAAAFHDVCGQAVKNLGVMTPQWNRKFNKEIWDSPWKLTKKKTGEVLTVSRRVRLAPPNIAAKRSFEQLDELLRLPTTTREVWIVMAQGLAIDKFNKARQSDHPKGNILQMLFLLQSTWGAVSSVGATLRIFCQP